MGQPIPLFLCLKKCKITQIVKKVLIYTTICGNIKIEKEGNGNYERI